MKKSIALLISLFFIGALSALILQNLKDTQNYVLEQNSKISKLQVISLIDNTYKEIAKIVKLYGSNEEFSQSLEHFSIPPFLIQDAKLFPKLSKYEKKDLNIFKSGTPQEKLKLKEFLYDNDIFNVEILESEVKNLEGSISNSKQFDYIIENYVKKSYDNNIYNIQDKIGFIKTTDKKFYELNVKIEYLKQFIKAYYILDDKGVIQHFEFNIK